MKTSKTAWIIFIVFAALTSFFNIGFADELIVTEDGNVGIGISNPLQKLSIAGGGIQLNGGYGIGFNGEVPYNNDVPNPSADKARFYFDTQFTDAAGSDYLVIEKTDGNNSYPDGGIAFTNKGIDNVRRTAFVIRGTGNVGIGTDSPSSKLSIYGANNGSGDAIQIHGGSASTTKYGIINVHDTDEYMRLGYFNGTAMKTIFLDGNVGIGTSAPAAMLHIKKDAATGEEMIAGGIKLENPGVTSSACAGSADIFLGYYYVDYLGFNVNGNFLFYLNELGDASLAGTLTENSDIELKEEITPLEGSLDKITQLQGVNYKWKDKEKRGDKLQLGLIAQDVEEVFPEAVSEDIAGMKGIAYSRLIAPLIEAVKELKMENDELKKKYADLEKRVAALEK